MSCDSRARPYVRLDNQGDDDDSPRIADPRTHALEVRGLVMQEPGSLDAKVQIVRDGGEIRLQDAVGTDKTLSELAAPAEAIPEIELDLDELFGRVDLAEQDLVDLGEDLDDHVGRVDNPHATTAAQVGALATTGGNLTGPLVTSKEVVIGSQNGAADSGLKISRYYNLLDNEYVKVSVIDATASVEYVNDEPISVLELKVTSTDTETGAGENANNTRLLLRSTPTGADLRLRHNDGTARTFWHDGSFDPASKADVGHNHDGDYAPLAHDHSGVYRPVGNIPWAELDDVPATFPPSVHGHGIGDVVDLQTTLDGKAPKDNPTFNGNVNASGAIRAASYVSVGVNSPSNERFRFIYNSSSGDLELHAFDADSVWRERLRLGNRNNAKLQIIEDTEEGKTARTVLDNHSSLAAERLTGSIHLDRIPLLTAEKIPNLEISKISGLSAELDKRVLDDDLAAALSTKADVAHDHDDAYRQITVKIPWADLDDVPESFPPSVHGHALADLPVAASGESSGTKLVRADDTRLSDARMPVAHGHGIEDVTGLQTALDGKASKTNARLEGGTVQLASTSSISIARFEGRISGQTRTGDIQFWAQVSGSYLKTNLPLDALELRENGTSISSKYATTDHDHDGVYSPVGHTHSDLATRVNPNIEGTLGIVGTDSTVVVVTPTGGQLDINLPLIVPNVITDGGVDLNDLGVRVGEVETKVDGIVNARAHYIFGDSNGFGADLVRAKGPYGSIFPAWVSSDAAGLMTLTFTSQLPTSNLMIHIEMGPGFNTQEEQFVTELQWSDTQISWRCVGRDTGEPDDPKWFNITVDW